LPTRLQVKEPKIIRFSRKEIKGAPMKRLLFCLMLMICFSCIASAQPDAKTQKLLDDATRNGNGLQSRITVNDNVHVQAVLIPQKDVNRIFGKEIARNYAVIEVNVSNKSKDAALIIHGVFIDYREWPFSGATSAEINAARSTDSYQSSSFPNQVATEEYRVVRGQLLDAQTDSVRNAFLRWLTLAGNLAGAFTFSINEQGIVKGIAAITGVGIPGVATAWPDRTIEQLNRVSDLGFRSNKVIPREGSDVMICFFPIDRFLTRGFRKLFLKSPALFFAPGQMLMDKSVNKDVDDAIGNFLQGIDVGTASKDTASKVLALRNALPCFFRITHPVAGDPAYDVCLDDFGLQRAKGTRAGELRYELKHVDKDPPAQTDKDKFRTFMALQFINSVSLNRVTITVDGVMAVDVKTIAARIEDVKFETVTNCGDEHSQCFWANITEAEGVRTGTISGAYLTGGTVVIAEASKLGITEVSTIPEGSLDTLLQFSFKLTKPIEPESKITFLVSKAVEGSSATEPKALNSVPFEYPVRYDTKAPAITSATQEGNKLTVKGSGFFNLPLVVKLYPRFPLTGEAIEVKPTSVSSTGDQLVLTIPDDAKPAGCWDVLVEVNKLPSGHSSRFVIKPNPTLDSAIRDTTRNIIIVTGDDLIDTTRCGGPLLTFKLVKEGAASIPVPVLQSDPQTKQAALALPKAAKEGSGWSVHLLVDGKDVANAPIE
jgi:hypothetical protein